MCGDHSCVDKKEFKEYFAQNLIIEIKREEPKNKFSTDLVKLNTLSATKDSKNEKSRIKFKKTNKKEEKEKLKARKLLLKEERKIKKINEKNKNRKKKRIVKLKNINKKNYNKPNIIKKVKPVQEIKKSIINDNQQEYQKEVKKNSQFKSVKTVDQVSICKDVKDCDIEKIAELLSEKGNMKDYPDITSK
jgi:hypothetical protein